MTPKKGGKTVKANINDEKTESKVEEFLEYKFTEPELKSISNDLARTTNPFTAAK